MRVLVATVTAGAGHLQAAAAVHEAWQRERPRDEIRMVDVLELAPPLWARAYARGYLELVRRAPALWSLLFRKSDDPALVRRLGRFRRLSARASVPRFRRLLASFQPEVVVATHFLPPELVGDYHRKARAASRPFLATVITDFEAHALWLEPAVDLYCVAAPETRDRLLARGVPGSRLRVTGIPIASRFARAPGREQARAELGLAPALPTLLVLSGGFGLGPLDAVLDGIDRLSRKLQTVVVCGRNESLRQRIERRPRRHPTTVLGFASNMETLMSAADLVLTKPGGLSSSEALAIGRPLLLLEPIPGQEEANSDHLLSLGAALKLNRVEDLPYRLERLLASAKLVEMARSARKAGRTGAATALCRTVVRAALAAKARQEGSRNRGRGPAGRGDAAPAP